MLDLYSVSTLRIFGTIKATFFQREMLELREWSTKLIAKQPEHKGEIQRALKRLQNVEHQLRQAWEAKNAALARDRNRQLFVDQANRSEQWLTSKEAFLKQVRFPSQLVGVKW